MKRAVIGAMILWAGCVAVVSAEKPKFRPGQGSFDLADSARPSLGRVRAFELADPQGKLHTERSWRDAKAVVLVFLGTECPVSNGYSPEIQRLYKEYAPRGVLFYGVHCDTDVTPAMAAEHAKEYSLPLVLLMDHEQVLARQVGARVTPDAIVVLPGGEVAYRGRLDNRYAETGKRRLEATEHDLENAIAAVLAGKLPDPPETKAFGCPLPRLNSSADSK